LISKAHTGRTGIYYVKDGACDDLDYMTVDLHPLPIRWPLGVEEYCDLYAKSLVVIAGEPNAGKTAFLLNTAKINKNKFDVQYFSSEMGAAELRIRLDKFDLPLDFWKPIKFKSRSSDFKDVINPNGLNIIDYLEISKDFYEIGGFLTEIFNCLDQGIAVVAIQKPRGRDVGIGGERTLDKARLYLSISPDRLKIVKGKLWRSDHVNPNGLSIKFNLTGGAKFQNETPWTKD
jgi:hypothetical protein